jgi:hypothetical protein
MTSPADRNLDPPAGEKEVVDRLPPSERGQDEARTEVTHQTGSSRPLTSEEREAAEQDAPLPERVYAPASERVPKEPVPGHRDMVEHTDTHTPERQAAADDPSATASVGAEPPVARVARPGSGPATTPTPVATPYASAATNPALESVWSDDRQPSVWQRGGSWAWLLVPVGVAFGVWLYVRRRREQNKPINRLRRQARLTAAEIRDRVPDRDELIQPAMGLLAAAASTGVVAWRQAQRQRAVKRASAAISEVEWQRRLNALKERWNPGRLELEKISISRNR